MQENNTAKKLGELFKSLCLLLTLLFTAFRACGINNWDWYWVIFPLLVYYGVELIAIIFLGFVKLGETIKGNKSGENNHKSR